MLEILWEVIVRFFASCSKNLDSSYILRRCGLFSLSRWWMRIYVRRRRSCHHDSVVTSISHCTSQFRRGVDPVGRACTFRVFEETLILFVYTLFPFARRWRRGLTTRLDSTRLENRVNCTVKKSRKKSRSVNSLSIVRPRSRSRQCTWRRRCRVRPEPEQNRAKGATRRRTPLPSSLASAPADICDHCDTDSFKDNQPTDVEDHWLHYFG